MSGRQGSTGLAERARLETRDLGVTSMCMLLKVMGLGEITKGVSVDTKGKRSKSEALECLEVGKMG